MQDDDSAVHREEDASRCYELSGRSRDVGQGAYERERYYPHTNDYNYRCELCEDERKEVRFSDFTLSRD